MDSAELYFNGLPRVHGDKVFLQQLRRWQYLQDLRNFRSGNSGIEGNQSVEASPSILH